MRGVSLALTLLLAGTLSTLPAPAPQGEIQVLDQWTESHFPDSLVFHLRVRSDAEDVVGATLWLQVGWEDTLELIAPEPFPPGPEVELTGVWNTFGETVPPFIEVTYYWEVTVTTGETFVLEPVRTEYVDATHDWQRLEDDQVIVLWYDQPASFGETLFEAAQEAYEHVARITGIKTERAIRVVIYNRQNHFCVFFAPRTCQDWIGGLTLSGITVQWGPDPDWFVYRAVPHELAHVFYGQVFRDTWVPIPTWFNEGIAVYNERHDHTQEMESVLDAAERGELETLPVMTRGGGVAHREVNLWYAVAYSLVAYLAETYGEETLGELILTLADSVPFEEALTETTGLDMVQLEVKWRAWLGYPVESVPTPVPFPTMPPLVLATPPRGRPAATATPRPPETPTATTVPSPPHGLPVGVPCTPCRCLPGLALPLGGLAALGLARRRDVVNHLPT